jgi:hypothetical protein
MLYVVFQSARERIKRPSRATRPQPPVGATALPER